jgi:hypothetical protein
MHSPDQPQSSEEPVARDKALDKLLHDLPESHIMDAISLLSSDDGACVRVAAIDAFTDSVAEAGGGVSVKYSAAVVDEGHVVFSHQSDPQLHGQHRFADPAKVRAALELALRPGAPVVVFHDENYQRVGGNDAAALALDNDGGEGLLRLATFAQSAASLIVRGWQASERRDELGAR